MTLRNDTGRPRRRTTPVIGALVVSMVAVEAALLASDLALIGPPGLRNMAVEYGGFWPGLLTGWAANYPTQPWVMFASYAFLHGGPFHLAVNMITLLSLGQPVIHRVGGWGFLAIYTVAIIGGALGYAAIGPGHLPMVGASGALFGLAGAWLAWEYIDRYAAHTGLWPVVRIVAVLIALNVVLWYAMSGHLAWQTHLGGFITGWIAALLIDPQSRRRSDNEGDDNGRTA